ncbi:uncharacterized protein LOC127849787 [Dreissena polymorpha]|uniref:uncharacterized protein LOC127849787 n=1 Tax=Dreissena polymorpha TaxID=45954 RepID=UPI0022656AAD|nr:uncharacterized protein LOC127849787 [Dreissena polymorpha]
MKVRFTALDRPDYRTTAGIDMGKLLSKGLGRRPESNVILPLASTYDDLQRKATELFPVLDGMAFDLVEGKRGNKLLPLDAGTTLGAIRSSNRGAEFARLWVLPDTYISTENATMWPDDRTEPSMDTSPIPDMDNSASFGASSSQVATTPIEAETE